MATDWPGHGATNRHISIPANCDCQILFTLDNQPPWFYQYDAFNASPPTWWAWMNGLKFFYPTEHEFGCEYRYQILDPFTLDFKELLLTIEIQPSEPDQIVATLRATHIGGVQTSQYTNSVATGVIPGPRVNRSTVWTFPANTWIMIVDSPIAQGSPNVLCSLFPQDCLVGWEWGELLPISVP